MNFKVDQELCIGCGACERTCPAVFELRDDHSHVKRNPVLPEHQEKALKAEDECPVGAISHG